MPAQSPERPQFQQVQYAFAAHLRNPEKNAAPADVEERRMQIYRELFYNNVEGFLAGNFPVFKSLCSEEYWHQLARSFFDSHHCHTPYFLEIGEEFLSWLNGEREANPRDPGFMAELMHYEWVELALDSSETEIPSQGFDAEADLLDGHPLQSPLAWSLAYQYPVHCIRPDYQPEQPGETPTCLIAYRNRDDEVRFMEINPVTARLLYLLSEDESLTGREALEQIAAEMQHPEPGQVIAGGAQTLAHLREAGVLLGTAI
ncbi:HvfC family RiPP maturation protein [Marinobacterium jannaschii]|uniref:HvfC family RiPP maturation protein n=1 Tax=Marinobacterium jannaschii TaxID=64970 RepID=UPI0004822815|nr:putative DNA-binding domain-containing protein [Marinobacterium jannaschii]